MKKTYIAPATECIVLAPAEMLALSLTKESDDSTVTNKTEILSNHSIWEDTDWSATDEEE